MGLNAQCLSTRPYVGLLGFLNSELRELLTSNHPMSRVTGVLPVQLCLSKGSIH
jgi:hypothetical protein